MKFVGTQLAVAVVLALGVGSLNAQDPAGGNSPAETARPSIEQLIQDLDSNDFKVREQATRGLIEQAEGSVAPVTKAAEGDSLEVTSRAVEVLHQLMDGENKAAAAAAKAALEKLAAGEHRNAARRAKAILTPPEPAQPQPNPFNQQIQIRGIQIGGGARIQVQNNNGNRVVDVDADGRKVHIEEAADGKIKMKVTEQVEGKEKTSEYEAKNAEELKKNEPKAHELYTKYGQGGGFGARVQINGGNIQIQAMPAQILPQAMPRARAMIVPQQALEKLEEAQKRIDEATERVKKLAENNNDLKPLIEELEKAQQELKEARGQFNR